MIMQFYNTDAEGNCKFRWIRVPLTISTYHDAVDEENGGCFLVRRLLYTVKQ